MRNKVPLHIHLDLVGGIAGDMFLSAITDARPELVEGLMSAFNALELPSGVSYSFEERSDGIFRGRGFLTDEKRASEKHTHFPELCERIRDSTLADSVIFRAIRIFTILAEAESEVHGVPLERVSFHEVGAWDSVLDIVGAAFLIDQLGCTWSWGPVPLGGGFVKTAHGSLPIPAPATSILLKGFEFFDDGLYGERVTPTGAAILRHLTDLSGMVGGKLGTIGIGFGTSKLEGKSNILRASVFSLEPLDSRTDTVGVLEFEVDDQSPEDLAHSLDLIRVNSGVLDVVQWPCLGKKNRIGAHIQVLCLPECLNDVQNLCLLETSTIGLRWRREERSVLGRRTVTVEDGGTEVRVKIVDRPDGSLSTKAEHEDIRLLKGHYEARKLAKTSVEKKARE
ncbi:MAG: LarC family nickel insertion protein [Pseudomonadota bacterium]|nr:LarC family nickel insertion protein [Pseudomonadota bacterium]